jgi:hypothetical protein
MNTNNKKLKLEIQAVPIRTRQLNTDRYEQHHEFSTIHFNRNPKRRYMDFSA